MEWREYQQEVADFFQSLDFTVEVEARLQGIRTNHAVDVWAQRCEFGLFTRWVVECKAWKRPVDQERVLALRTIVGDLGANHGILVNERGFQSGAEDATDYTNVTVTTLAALREGALEDLAQSRLEAAHSKAFELEQRAGNLWAPVNRLPTGGRSRLRQGVDTTCALERMGMIAMAERAAAAAKLGNYPVVLPLLDDPLQVLQVGENTAAVEYLTELLRGLEGWVHTQEEAITRAGDWD